MKKIFLSILLTALLAANMSACTIAPPKNTTGSIINEQYDTANTQKSPMESENDRKNSLKNIDAPQSVIDGTLQEIGYSNSTMLVSIGAEALEFTSNGNGTCSVSKLIDKSCGTAQLAVTIPKRSPDGDLVTRIDTPAFQFCENLVRITIPDSVSEIEMFAFSFCTNLTEIDLPNGIEQISESTFYYCESLKSIKIPQSVSRIEESAFASCTNLSEVDFLGNISYIGHSAFTCCESLLSITLPEGLESMGRYVFADCHKLKNIVLPSTLTDIGYAIFVNCINLEKLESHSDKYHVTSENCVIETTTKTLIAAFGEFSLPEDGSVVRISAYAFGACPNLTELTLPQSIMMIDAHAFSFCKNLESLILSENLIEIGEEAFISCEKLAEISIPQGVKKLSRNIFANCKGLKCIYLPTSIEEIDKDTFRTLDSTIIYYQGTQEDWETLAKDLKNTDSIQVYCKN